MEFTVRPKHQPPKRGQWRAARRGALIWLGLLALGGCWPAMALADGSETVQIQPTGTATRDTATLTDADPAGTNPVDAITFNTTTGALTGAAVTQPGWECEMTGVGDAQACFGFGAKQAPGSALDVALTVSSPVASFKVCATTDDFATVANTTCQDVTVKQATANCDKQRQALADAQAKLTADRQQLLSAAADLATAERTLKEAQTRLDEVFTAISGVQAPELGGPLDVASRAVHEGAGDVIELKSIVDGLRAKVAADSEAATTARGALTACLKGGATPNARFTARVAVAAAAAVAASCPSQAAALGSAQGQAAAYHRLSQSFGRLHLGAATAKLGIALTKLPSLEAALARHKHGGATAAHDIRKLVSSLGTLELALHKTATLARSFAVKGAAAAKRVRSAQAAYTKCAAS